MKIFIFFKCLLRFTLICFLFKCTTAHTWTEFMKSAMWGTREVSNILKPYIVENFPTANVSDQCISSVIAYAEGLKNFEPWAIKMFDATGKPPSSFIRGTYLDFGSFDECLSLEIETNGQADTEKSQFCMLNLTSSLFQIKFGRTEKESYIKTYGYPPEWALNMLFMSEDSSQSVGLYLGICVPSSCSDRDLTNIISAYANPLEIQVSLSDCQVNEPRKWSTSEKVAIFSMTCLIMIILIGTALDFIERKKKQKNVLYCNEGSIEKFKAFSIISNFDILFEKKKTDTSLDFIIGMKFWIVIWVLFLHTTAYETLWDISRFRNYTNIGRYFRHPLTIMYENGLPNTTYFIFLNGFL